MSTYALVLVLQGWCPWCGDHMGWAAGWMWLFWLVLLLLAVGVVWVLARRPASGPSAGGADRAEEALRERYARGEIDEATYRHMLHELRNG